MPAQGGVKFSPTCDLDYQVRTKSGEGQLTAACPHRGVNWTIRFGLSQGRSSDSSQQHARTGGGGPNSLLFVTWAIRFGLSQGRGSSQQQGCELNYQARTKSGEVFRHAAHSSMPAQAESNYISVTCELYYLRSVLRQGRFSDSSQQHACTARVKFSPTCKLDYVGFGLSQVRL